MANDSKKDKKWEEFIEWQQEEISKEEAIKKAMTTKEPTYMFTGVYNTLDLIQNRMKEEKDIAYFEKYAELYIKLYKELKGE